MATFLLVSCQTKKIGIDEMNLSSMEIGRGKIQVGKSTAGNPLSVGGKVFEKGIGTRAVSKYLIGLDGKGIRFTAKVGIDDSSRQEVVLNSMFWAIRKSCLKAK